MRYAPGLYAVNRDGTGFRQLAMRAGNRSSPAAAPPARELLPWHTYLLDQDGAQDSDYIYVQDRDQRPRPDQPVDLLRLNTVTGRINDVVQRPGDSTAWLLDRKASRA
jgi:hypothetical protein